ncbi:MAG: hypothetical protein C0458_11905 [Methylobacterium sp.]|nr:hypothetical protein [Methylobacterium sp.]
MEIQRLAGILQLDKAADVALYAQVRDFIATEIIEGRLSEGERLPPVRALAEAANVNVMTIARAYRELSDRGLIAGRGALGTFVQGPAEEPPAPAPAAPSPRDTLPNEDGDTFRRMLKVGDLPDIVPLTRAYPDASLIDTGAFEQKIGQILKAKPEYAYSYIAPDGLPNLKAAFARFLERHRQLHCDVDDMIVTSGGQQGISITIQSLVSRGDTVIVENPTYFGLLDLLRNMGANAIGIDMQQDGMAIEQLSEVVRSSNAKAIFTMPTYQNPTGITTSLEKRRAILGIGRRHGIPIIEDDCFSELRFEGDFIPSIKSLSEPEDLVYYIVSMGKTLIPGMRLGFVLAPPARMEQVTAWKSVSDLHTAPLLQDAFAAYLDSAEAEANLSRIRKAYKPVLDTVIQGLAENLPAGSTFTRPHGGLNLWVKLPAAIDPVDFFYACLRRNVGILTGVHLTPEKADNTGFRLSYGLSDRDALGKAVRQVCRAAADLSKRSSSRFPVIV